MGERYLREQLLFTKKPAQEEGEGLRDASVILRVDGLTVATEDVSTTSGSTTTGSQLRRTWLQRVRIVGVQTAGSEDEIALTPNPIVRSHGQPTGDLIRKLMYSNLGMSDLLARLSHQKRVVVSDGGRERPRYERSTGVEEVDHDSSVSSDKTASSAQNFVMQVFGHRELASSYIRYHAAPFCNMDPFREILRTIPSGTSSAPGTRTSAFSHLRIVEGGAHLGDCALLAASLLPDSRVVAIEPLPDAARLLTLSAALNGFSDRLVTIPKALGAPAVRFGGGGGIATEGVLVGGADAEYASRWGLSPVAANASRHFTPTERPPLTPLNSASGGPTPNDKSVVPSGAGVSSFPQTTDLTHLPGRSASASSFDGGYVWNCSEREKCRTFTVPVAQLDDLIDFAHLVKLSIQGAEMDALEGSRELFLDRRICSLLVYFGKLNMGTTVKLGGRKNADEIGSSAAEAMVDDEALLYSSPPHRFSDAPEYDPYATCQTTPKTHSRRTAPDVVPVAGYSRCVSVVVAKRLWQLLDQEAQMDLFYLNYGLELSHKKRITSAKELHKAMQENLDLLEVDEDQFWREYLLGVLRVGENRRCRDFATHVWRQFELM